MLQSGRLLTVHGAISIKANNILQWLFFHRLLKKTPLHKIWADLHYALERDKVAEGWIPAQAVT